MGRALALLCLLTAIGAGGARAEIVSYQKGDGKLSVSETDDARMNSGSPTTNYGGTDFLVVDQDAENHSVLKFPNIFGTGPNQIPPGSRILNATLTVWVFDAGQGDEDCPSVYQLIEGFDEAQVTWNNRITAVPWSNTGADGPLSHKPAREGGTFLQCDTNGSFESISVKTSVQNWSDGEPNEGWVLVNGPNNNGVDISSSEDTDLAERPELTVEFVPAVFYSIGTDSSDLKTGSPKMDLVAGVATLDVAQAQDIGVGDVVDFGGSNTLVYIWEVVSPTVVQVQNGDGTLPADAANQDVNSIKRAFNSIGAAVTGSAGASYLGNGDLTAVNRRLTWICYDDGPFNVSSTTAITGYTTDATRFITLTVAGATQVVTGNSQRHGGIAGTGARMEATGSGFRMLQLNEAYTVVEWLELDGNDQSPVLGVWVASGAGSLLSNMVLHHFGGGTDASVSSAVFLNGGSVELRNTFAYLYDGDGVNAQLGTTLDVFNSTFYGGRTANSEAVACSGTCLAENVLASTPRSFPLFNEGPVPAALTLNNCISEDASADDYGGSGNLISRAATDQFRSLAGTIDLHLRPGADALEAGKDLSSSFTDDIDDQARPLGALWDVGADEASLIALPRYRSIGTAAPLVDEGTITVTVGSPVVTKSGGLGWLAQNRGRGDALRAGAEEYMIQAVVSDDQLIIASLPTTGYIGPNYTIDRQHATLAGWYDCVANNAVCPYFPVASSSLVADDRREVGIVYKETALTLGASWDLRDAITDADHDITLTADPGNRHLGVPGVGARIDQSGFDIRPADSYLTIEWLETYNGATRGLHLNDAVSSPSRLVLRYLLLHNHGSEAIRTFGFWDRLEIYNNIIYTCGQGIDLDTTPLPSETLIANNTVYSTSAGGIGSGNDPNPGVFLFNNVAIGNGAFDYDVPNLEATSSNNLSGAVTGPNSGTTHSPAGGGKDGLAATSNAATCSDPDGCVGFQSLGAPRNYHLIATVYPNEAVDAGADLSALIPPIDIDGQWRTGTWDAGADEFGATTAVELISFTAQAGEGAVDLTWETGSELDNLGFYLHRSASAAGPWTTLTPELIPGLGSSPLGASYSWPDVGLQGGVEYFYLLEDVDAASISTFHGPVSAVPFGPEETGGAGEGGEAGGGEGGREPSEGGGASGGLGEGGTPGPCAPDALPGECDGIYGEPGAPSLRVVSRSLDHVVVELSTPGFVATPDGVGQVRVSIPGFDERDDPRAPALPLRRVLLDAVVGRHSRLAYVQATEEERYPGLVPAAVGYPEMDVRPDGTVRPRRRPATLDLSVVVVPREPVVVRGTAFQGEAKTLTLELSPLRYDSTRQELVLARRLLFRVDFVGRDTAEAGAGRIGRRAPRTRPGGGHSIAFLHTVGTGLHRVSFEEVYPGGGRSLPLGALGLERQGEPVPFRVEPDSGVFGPGSVLYFFADQVAPSGSFTGEVAWELVRSSGGVPMATASAAPYRGAVSRSLGTGSWETNRIYQPGLLEAPDLWLWEAVPDGATRTVPFTLSGLDPAAATTARVTVHLQGGSAAGVPGDHHLRFWLGAAGGGTTLGEASFDGKAPHVFSADLLASLLQEGENQLTVENIGDTGVHSLVFLDRIEVEFPQRPSLRQGRLEAVFPQAGSLTLDVAPPPDPEGPASLAIARGPLPSPGDRGGRHAPRAIGGGAPLRALDITDPAAPLWLHPVEPAGSSVQVGVAAGRRYLFATPEGILSPRVEIPALSTLRSPRNQADYILIAPEAFLPAAEPLIARRQDQGLTTRVVSLETIAAVFGDGQSSGEAIRRFLSFTFHQWTAPAPRYVVLLGDSSYDPRNFTGVAPPAPLPALWTRTSYLWTVSDPALAAVNGEDPLPDLAIGRLPAATLEEAEGLVRKLLDWEASGQTLGEPPFSSPTTPTGPATSRPTFVTSPRTC